MTTIPLVVNAQQDWFPQVDVRDIDPATGRLRVPPAGGITGVLFRLSLTPGGAALDPAVDAIATTERSGVPGRFYAGIDKSVMAGVVLAAVGDGGTFYLIASKVGDFDKLSVTCTLKDGISVQ